MKLYIQQKVFSFGDRFTVYNEREEMEYYVEGEVFTLGKKLHIYNKAGYEAAYIQQKLFSFLPRYYIYYQDMMRTEIHKEISFFNPVYSADRLAWEIKGDFFAHDYDISEGSTHIASINKAYLTWGDFYELDILDERDELDALCVTLAVDCAIEQTRSPN